MNRQAATTPAGPQELSPRLLSATLAHELNNIVASLRGFVEIGADLTHEQVALQRIFTEVRIGTERAAALAADLEVLAGGGASPRPTPLQQCLALPASGAGSPTTATVPVKWECDAQSAVLVDAAQARQAIALLRRIGSDGPVSTAPLCGRIPEATTQAPLCAFCAAPVPVRSAWLVQPLPPGRGRSRSAPTPSRGHLSSAELRLAVLSHAAHAAGGHVVRQSDPDWLALVLPLA